MEEKEFLEETELYRSHLEFASRYPAIIQMELTSECNLRCIMCPLSSIDSPSLKDSERLLTLNDLKQLEQAILNADELELTGFGEDLYHPQVLEILRWFKSLKVGVNITTNGQLLTPELSKIIVRENLVDILCFSIDAATGYTYRRVRRGGSWNRLISNLQALKKEVDKTCSSIPVIYFSFCAMRRNIHELPDFVRMAKSFGAKKVIVQHVFENKNTVGENLINYPELAQKFITEAQAIANELNIVLEVTNISPAELKDIKWSERSLIFSPKLFREKNKLIKDCEFPWVRCFIRPDKTVQACPVIWPGLILGSLMKNTLEQIWSSDSYKRFRLEMGTFDTPDACVICMYRGWRKPLRISELKSFVNSDPKDEQFGVGWHQPELDETGRWSRWTRQKNSFFLKNSDFVICELEIYKHPSSPELNGKVIISDLWEFPFTHYDLWGEPVRVPIPSGLGELLRVDIALDRLWRPNQRGIYDNRNLGLLFYGAKLKVKRSELKSKIYVSDIEDSKQLGFGFLPPERRGLKKVRWIQKRAYLVLKSEGNTLSIWGYTPRGLDPRIVEIRVNNALIGRVKFENTDKPKRYDIPISTTTLEANDYSIVELCALNAENIPKTAERPFGIIVYKVAMR